ncbi:MAG: DUF433 domain-containing protein [Alphaproteobacteria bacterium]|nr:DUF433 domain-containing protein [Alphaproteobacteria bacterium]
MYALTPNEVAAITGLDERLVRKDLEQGVVTAESPPRFGQEDVIYFMARALFALELGTRERRRLHSMIEGALRGRRQTVELGTGWTLDLATIERTVDERIGSFDAWKAGLTITDSVLAGEPAFPGSRLAVRRVGEALRNGVSRDELLEDYPYLTGADLDFAALYTTAYPRVGRPRAQAAPG